MAREASSGLCPTLFQYFCFTVSKRFQVWPHSERDKSSYVANLQRGITSTWERTGGDIGSRMTSTLSGDGGRRGGLASDSVRCHSCGPCCLLNLPEGPPSAPPPHICPPATPLHAAPAHHQHEQCPQQQLQAGVTM